MTAPHQPSALALLRLDLIAAEGAAFTADPVRAVHAALHRLLEEVDPALAHEVHEAGVKPLTLSSLYTDDSDQPSPVPIPRTIPAGARVWLRLGLLDAPTLAATRLALTAALGNREPLVLEWRPFHLTAVADILPPTTYDALLAAATPVDELVLHFTSPTVFRHKGVNLLRPEPRLVFGSLLRRWQTFAPTPLPIAGDDIFAAQIRLAGAQTAVVRHEVGPIAQPGFTGWARYAIAPDADLRRLTAALAAAVPFAGIGARTAFGMGQTRLGERA